MIATPVNLLLNGDKSRQQRAILNLQLSEQLPEPRFFLRIRRSDSIIKKAIPPNCKTRRLFRKIDQHITIALPRDWHLGELRTCELIGNPSWL